MLILVKIFGKMVYVSMLKEGVSVINIVVKVISWMKLG